MNDPAARAYVLAARIEAGNGVADGLARIAETSATTVDVVTGVLVSLTRAGIAPAALIAAVIQAGKET